MSQSQEGCFYEISLTLFCDQYMMKMVPDKF